MTDVITHREEEAESIHGAGLDDGVALGDCSDGLAGRHSLLSAPLPHLGTNGTAGTKPCSTHTKEQSARSPLCECQCLAQG